MKKIVFYCTALFATVLVSCKVDVDNAVKLNKVEFTIKTDDNGAIASTAKVFIYDSEAAYQNDYTKEDTIGASAINKGITTSGKFNIELTSNKPYWVRVIYFQKSAEVLNAGKTVMYSNDELGVQFGPFESKNFENNNLTTKASITLTKAYCYLLVAAKDNASIEVSVFNARNKACEKLSFNNNLVNSGALTIGSLDELEKNLFTKFDKQNQQYMVFVVPKGNISIYYKSMAGCNKVVNKKITGDKRVVVDVLESCVTGTLVFYNKSSDFTDIKVILSTPSDTIGTLEATELSYTHTNVCDFSSSRSLIKVSREIGTYKYVATSKSGNREIKGTVSITTANECKPVEILLTR